MRIENVKKPPTWVRVQTLSGKNLQTTVKSTDIHLENAKIPAVEEPAVSHPFNTSTIKIRNNGMIDMFVGTDQGTRIDPYTKTINHIANGLKWHLGYFRGWIDVDAEWYANSHFYFKSVESSFNVNVKTDINMNCERHKNEWVGVNEMNKVGNNLDVEVGNNETREVGNNQTIEIGGNLEIKVAGEIRITSGGNTTMKASNIYMN